MIAGHGIVKHGAWAHNLRVKMVAVSSVDNLRNEIIWLHGKWINVPNALQRSHDTILFNAKTGTLTFKLMAAGAQKGNELLCEGREGGYATSVDHSGQPILLDFDKAKYKEVAARGLLSLDVRHSITNNGDMVL